MEPYREYFRTKSETLRFAAGVSAIDPAILEKIEVLIWEHYAREEEEEDRPISDDLTALIKPIYLIVVELFMKDDTLVQKIANYISLCKKEIEHYYSYRIKNDDTSV